MLVLLTIHPGENMNLNACPECGASTWGQRGSKEEEAKGESYRVCQSAICGYSQKIRWDKVKEKAFIMH